ncbi:Cobalt-containing nitrile hydratase subunit alpha [Klebsiella variicola]|uniref:Cobalt-containing nitrile hydratase subunit alpha n=1 Tax=Klebsiella variicola TaxID=244366 RepID=A0A7H4MK47_KLEVA|nr:Cobalt-containing nitrile hydratase subunit alpha [Klebsiella variicola]
MSHQHDHDHTEPPADIELRVRALESLLQEKGLIDPAALDELIDTYEHKVGPRNGAQVVAKAWSDPEYKRRLLADATAAIAELGFSGVQGEDMQVVENTPDVHNVTVCTLCSCYPLAGAGSATGVVQIGPPIVRVSLSTRAAFWPNSG